MQIGIAGGGVAGLAAGALLARAGRRVTLFDKLEAPAPVGSGLILQPVGLAVLEELGLRSRIEALGAPIDRLFGRAAPSGSIVLDVRYRALGPGVRGLAVHRGALFELLLQAAKDAGVQFEPRAEVLSAEDRSFALAGGKHAGPFDLLVDALGARSPLSIPGALLPYGALWANIPWPADGPFDPHTLEQRYFRAKRMVGVLPIGRLPDDPTPRAAFFWSLKHEDLKRWSEAPLEAWARDVAALWPETAPLVRQLARHEELIFAAYSHRTHPRPVEGRLVHLGDSYRCTSPQLGQGANMALLDALALADALARTQEIPEALARYAAARRWHTRIYQLASYLFTPAYQSDSTLLPFLRDRVVSWLSRMPPAPTILAALVAGRVGAPLAAMGWKGA